MAELGLDQRDLARAEQLYEHCLTLLRQVHADGQVAGTRVVLGNLAQRRQLLDRAAQCYEEALAVYRVLRQRAVAPYPDAATQQTAAAFADRSMASVLRALGDAARGQGDAPRATAYYEQNLALYGALAELPGLDLVHHADDRRQAEGLAVRLWDMAYAAHDPARAAAFDAQSSTLLEAPLGITPRLFGAMVEDERRATPRTGPADPGADARLGRGQRWWQRLLQ